jgi:hypothetical protein
VLNHTVAGRVLYDAFGGVLTRTLPLTSDTVMTDTEPLTDTATLTPTLSPALIDLLIGQGAADPDTDLVYLGSGRYFDPLLGLPLQPNPMGGVPIVPQSLNRYAATSLGPPGVAEGVVSNPSFTNLSLATGFLKSSAFETLARTTWGPFGRISTHILSEAYAEISIRASHAAITRAAEEIQHLGGGLLDPGVGLGQAGSGKYTRVFKLGQGLTNVDDLMREANLPTRGGWKAAVTISNVDEIVSTSRFARLQWLRDTRLGFATDTLLSAGFQGYEDSFNPYFTPGQRAGRVFFAGLGGFGSSVTGYFAAVVSVSAFCGPGAGVCAAAVGTGIAVATAINAIWSYGIQPVIFKNVEALQPPPQNLKPLVIQ